MGVVKALLRQSQGTRSVRSVWFQLSLAWAREPEQTLKTFHHCCLSRRCFCIVAVTLHPHFRANVTFGCQCLLILPDESSKPAWDQLLAVATQPHAQQYGVDCPFQSMCRIERTRNMFLSPTTCKFNNSFCIFAAPAARNTNLSHKW